MLFPSFQHPRPHSLLSISTRLSTTRSKDTTQTTSISTHIQHLLTTRKSSPFAFLHRSLLADRRFVTMTGNGKGNQSSQSSGGNGHRKQPTYPTSTPEATAAGSSSRQGGSNVESENWDLLVENPDHRMPAPADWRNSPIVRASMPSRIPEFWRMTGARHPTGCLIPDDYQVPIEWMARSSKGSFIHPRAWLAFGMRLHHFTLHFPRLVCKWIFTRAKSPQGEFVKKWGRVFDTITPTLLQDDAWNAWYYQNRDAEWERQNPYGLDPRYPFCHETTYARQTLRFAGQRSTYS